MYTALQHNALIDADVSPQTTNAVHIAGRAAQAACNAWSAELQRLFGRHAGDVRYTLAGKGDAGSELRRLADEFTRTTTHWQALIDAARAARS